VEDADGTYAARLATHPAQHGHMDLQDFRSALVRLPDDQREALILVGAAGFSYEEAAEISGCAVGTIKSRVNRARNRLAGMLGLDELDSETEAETLSKTA
jgi:RNA polymerase sigma-70 factor (ECF subfamily)